MTMNLQIRNLTKQNAQAFEQFVLAQPGIVKVDTWVGRAELETTDQVDRESLLKQLKTQGFDAEFPHKKLLFAIDGMTCRSCELTIERRLKTLDGVSHVEVNASKGKAELSVTDGTSYDPRTIQKTIQDEKYQVRAWGEKSVTAVCKDRPSWARILGIFAVILLLGSLLERFGSN